MRKKFEENPPTLYGEPMKESEHESYLGEEIGLSVSDSITLTIRKRIGLVKKSIFEIKSIVEKPDFWRNPSWTYVVEILYNSFPS